MMENQVALLFVDDEANILAALRRLFRPQGYTIHTAESGAEGLKILDAEPIDLIISDMRMPGMDGAQFLAEAARRRPEAVRFLLTGYADLSSTIAAINEGRIFGYFSKPWEDNDIRLAVKHALERKRLKEERDRLLELTRRQNEALQDLNANLEDKVKARTEELRQTNMFLELSFRELKESWYRAIPVFAGLVQMREGAQAGHGARVAALARDLATRLGLDEDTQRHVEFAGLLHDMGKLGLPDELVATPYAKLKSEQRERFKRHPIAGQAILMGLESLQTTALFIRHHHETFDGKGYPDGLFGDGIPLGAKILSVVNEYDGLRTGLLLGDDLSVPDAREYIKSRAGSRYDPDVVAAFMQALDAHESSGGEVHELRVSPAELKPGMVLSRDLKTAEGMLLLTKGHALTEAMIARVAGFLRDETDAAPIHVRK